MKKILIIIFSSLFIVVVFVLLKYYTFEKVLPFSNRGMRAICHEQVVDNLFVGSSMFRQGIDADQLGKNSFLLAYNGNQPCYEAMQIRNLLNNGANIKRIIVDMYPYTATSIPSVSDVRMVMDGDIGFTIDVFSVLPRSDHSIRDLYELLCKKNNEFFITMPISNPLIDSRYRHGSSNSVMKGKSEQILSELEIENFSALEPNPVQLEGLEHIIEMCQENSIDLIFLETPKYYKITNFINYRLLMINYVSFLSSKGIDMIITSQTLNHLPKYLINHHICTYDFDDSNPLYYTDLFHISYEGRLALSKALSELFLK